MDRKRPKKGSNEEWMHPHDPDARITKMKNGRTHLAHKAEHAVDMETGAVVAVTVQPANAGDTQTVHETLAQAEEYINVVGEALNEAGEAGVVDPAGPASVVADKGYHSRTVIRTIAESGIRTYISEPERGRQRWQGQKAEQSAVYANRQRVRSNRGQRLQRQRGEKLERVNAHLYETGGMRRVHLRGHSNILKRLLIHAGGLNLGLLMRALCGFGTPRGLQGRSLRTFCAALFSLWRLLCLKLDRECRIPADRVTPVKGETPLHHRLFCSHLPTRC
jgi:transposase